VRSIYIERKTRLRSGIGRVEVAVHASYLICSRPRVGRRYLGRQGGERAGERLLVPVRSEQVVGAVSELHHRASSRCSSASRVVASPRVSDTPSSHRPW
jgi:hypothetical protein